MSRAARKTRRGPVRFRVNEPFEIEPGARLPAGRYPGRMVQYGYFEMDGEVDWAKPEYSMELSASELVRMGREPSGSDASFEIDMTRHVREKRVEVE